MCVVLRIMVFMARWVMMLVTSMVMISTRASSISEYCANIDNCGEGAECSRQAMMCNMVIMGLARGKRGERISLDQTDYRHGRDKIFKRTDSEDLSPSFFRLL